MWNPILKTEWLKEGRSIRLPIMIIFYDSILAFITILFMFFNTETFQEGYYYDTSSYIYQFLIISSLQIIIVFLIMPFMVSNIFVMDREKHMLEQFQMIPGVSGQFIIAKILLIISVSGLLFVSGLPIICLSCIYSGMSWFKVIRLGFMVIMYTFWSGSIAIFYYSITNKTLWAFTSTIFAEFLFFAGTIFLAALLCNGLNGSNPAMVSVISKICLFLLLLNPLASYMGYYGNLTGDSGVMIQFCSRFGVDASSKMFSLVFYKVSCIACVAVGCLFLAMAMWRYKSDVTGTQR